MSERQAVLFEIQEGQNAPKYTRHVGSPIYEPKNKKPHILALLDATKARKLIAEINASNISEDEKEFLRAAAYRHNVFDYEKIADYYANSSEDVQNLMEKSALVIIDFDNAIEQGFVSLCEKVRVQYMEDYNG